MAGPSIDEGFEGADEYFMEEYSLNSTTDTYNGSMGYPELPDKIFKENSILEIVFSTSIFIISTIGNIPVFVTLFRKRHRKSRMNLMLLHRTIADIMLTCVLPLETTNQWTAGNVPCKIFAYMKELGINLSSSILVCISVDRLITGMNFSNVNEVQRRCKIMLGLTWAASILTSIPKSILFHLERHPEYPQFIQCVSVFPTTDHQMVYKSFFLLTVYGIPMPITMFCISRILWKMARRSRNLDVSFPLADMAQQPYYRRRLCLRQQGKDQREKNRSRTLRMTILLVLVFFLCWTPYVIVVLWNIFHPVLTEKIDSKVESYLHMLAVSNSCFNPLVYGSYAMNFKEVFSKRAILESQSNYNPSEEDPFRESHL